MGSTHHPGWFTLQPDSDRLRFIVGGAWTIGEARRLDHALRC